MTNTTKMTQKVALEMAVQVMEEQGQNVEAIEVLKKMILTKENQSKKGKEYRNKKKEENAILINHLADLIKEKSLMIAEIKEDEMFKDFSTQKISALLKIVREQYNVEATCVKNKKAYKIVQK